MTSPLVSIVLPTFNGAKYIEQSISSVLNQTFSNWELIIVDDASTDETPALISKYVKSDPRIRSTRHSTNKRLPAALNTGFSQTHGEYLTWTSDDNYYREPALREMLEFLRSHAEADVVYSDYRVVYANDQLVRRMRVSDPDGLLTANCIGPCFLYTRAVCSIVGPYSTDVFLAEDYEFWLRAYASFLLVPLHIDLYSYRAHEKSLAGVYSTKEVRRVADVALARNLPKLKSISSERKADIYFELAYRAKQWHDVRSVLRFIALAAMRSPQYVLSRGKRIARKHRLPV